MEETRKLASIQKVSFLKPIEGADKIECAGVLGWEVVVGKGTFKEGDLCVYFEIDSLVPQDNPAFAFLAAKKWKVKTVRLRGQISQGLALPVSAFPVLSDCRISEGDDVTAVLGVVKYEKDDEDCDTEEKEPGWIRALSKWRFFRVNIKPIICPYRSKSFPIGIIAKSDETRIQNLSGALQNFQGKRFIMTEKLEGTSATYVLRRIGMFKRFDVFSRKTWRSGVGNVYGKMAKANNIREFLERVMKGSYAESVALQGEIVGPKIQGNIYGLQKVKIFVYRIKVNFKDGRHFFLSPSEIAASLCSSGSVMSPVPVIGEFRFCPETTVKDVLDLADGKSQIGDVLREGIVFVCDEDPEISFKAVSNKYLLEKDGK